MTERSTTIKLRIQVQDEIGNRLLEQAREAYAKVRAESAAAMKDLSAPGGAITSKAVAPLAQYQDLMTSALQGQPGHGQRGSLSPVRRSTELQRQQTLAQFWGTSGAMLLGINAMIQLSALVIPENRIFWI